MKETFRLEAAYRIKHLHLQEKSCKARQSLERILEYQISEFEDRVEPEKPRTEKTELEDRVEAGIPRTEIIS